MSISSLSDPPTPRDESPPIKPSPPPTTLPLASLPPSAQRVLVPPPSPLMPVDENLQASSAGTSGMAGEKVKGKEREGTGGRTGAEGVEFAYEYVQVSQRREGRQNMLVPFHLASMIIASSVGLPSALLSVLLGAISTSGQNGLKSEALIVSAYIPFLDPSVPVLSVNFPRVEGIDKRYDGAG